MSTPRSDALRISALTALPADSLALLDGSGFGPFAVNVFASQAEWLTHAAGAGCDALIVADDGTGSAQAAAAAAGPQAAILVVADALGPDATLGWLQCGAQDVLLPGELAAVSLPWRLRGAIERQRSACAARTAYATDLGTGLPHRQQLVEHMSQLLALREREPAPMALLALRVEGLATTETRFGREAANVLRRKLGVRLRAGVRASDVVAWLGDDSFAVLLGSILTPADAARVGAKLLKALLEPVRVAGQDVTVAAAIGIGQFPQDGSQPDALLRRAVGLAAAAPAQGRAGLSNFQEAGGRAPAAANDD